MIELRRLARACLLPVACLLASAGMVQQAAFGNSDGDFQMLERTTAGAGLRLAMIVHHDDAAREFAYDRGSHVGKLERGLDEAAARGWTVISMKNDWQTVYSPAR